MSTGVEPTGKAGARAYVLEGTLLEACSCNVLCPCWIGEDPDKGYCDAAIAYHIDSGKIEGLDVSGLTVVSVAHIPGNVFAGSWKVLRMVDERATAEQVAAVSRAFQGKLGGPLADLASLVGEEVGITQVPISYRHEEGRGTVVVEGRLTAEMTPLKRHVWDHDHAEGRRLQHPSRGSPAWVARVSEFTVDLPEGGFKWSLHAGNAIQGVFHLEA